MQDDLWLELSKDLGNAHGVRDVEFRVPGGEYGVVRIFPKFGNEGSCQHALATGDEYAHGDFLIPMKQRSTNLRRSGVNRFY